MKREHDASKENPADTLTCTACGAKYPSSVRFCALDGTVLRKLEVEGDPLIGSVVADRYLVQRAIGAGGMGVVYQAEHVFMKRKCALKVLKPDLLTRSDSIARFSREAQNASRITHPNVATVYDFGAVDSGVMYLAMELVEGVSLAKVLKSESRLTPARTGRIVKQIAAALDAAHSLGIVHRDLKPDNILLARTEDGSDFVKVIDFGIARAVSDNAQYSTGTSVIIGTPAYMSPEQLAGSRVDARSDIYALGLVSYSMLTGSLPFGTEHTELMLRFLQLPKKLVELDPKTDWPDGLQPVLDRSLAPNVDDRYQTPVEFATDFSTASLELKRDEINAARTARAQRRTKRVPRFAIHGAPSDRARATRWVAGIGTLAAVATVAFAVIPRTPKPMGNSEPVTSTVPSIPASTNNEGPLGKSDTTTALQQIPAKVSPAAANRAPVRPAGQNAMSGNTSPGAKSAPTKTESALRDTSTAAETTSVKAATTKDSSQTGRAPDPPLPSTATVILGPTGSLRSFLFVDGQLRGLLRETTHTVPSGDSVQLKLRMDGCRDWDTTLVNVRGGSTIRIGNRGPKCQEK